MLEDFDLNSIQDIEGARQAILQLLNLVDSYDVPCVEFFEISDGNPEYLEWIKKETEPC